MTCYKVNNNLVYVYELKRDSSTKEVIAEMPIDADKETIEKILTKVVHERGKRDIAEIKRLQGY